MLANLFGSTEQRLRIAAVSGCGVLAVLVGFVAFSPSGLESFIRQGGYHYIGAVFGLFVVYVWRVADARREVWRGWLRRPGRTGLCLIAASLFVLWSDGYKHKILFDEYVLQGTAFQLHAMKEYGAMFRAYEIAGSWVPIDSFMDKRPYFFAFLVSLLHDLAGYRLANIFIVNSALAVAFLPLVYWLSRTVVARGPALLAVGLMASLPLLGQNATGAGMELHNLVMIALTAALGVLYLRAPDNDRAAALVLAAVLLAQSRYESVIYVLPAALVLVLGWFRAGRLVLPWPAIIAPLLLVPYAWHNRVLSATPQLWQLQEGQTRRFSFEYLPGNLTGAWNFFFDVSGNLANSWYLSAFGLVGIFWAVYAGWRWARAHPRAELGSAPVVLLAFGAGAAGNLGVLMFYYWSRLDDVIASRFALPSCLLLAIVAAVFADRAGGRRQPALRWAAAGLVVWLLVGALPAMSRRLYTEKNVLMQEITWEHSVLESRPGPLLFLTNKSTIPFVLWRIPSLINSVGRQRGPQISYHLGQGTFREVIIAQGLRPTTEQGDMGIDPLDFMPPEFELETIGERRFGNRWARLSRLVRIKAPPVSTPPPAAAGTDGDLFKPAPTAEKTSTGPSP